MTPDERARRARARARSGWTGRVLRGSEREADVPPTLSTAEERVAQVWALTLDAWAMAGLPIPDCPRSEAPGRVIRTWERE